MLPPSLEITWLQNVSNDVVSFFKNDAAIKHIYQMMLPRCLEITLPLNILSRCSLITPQQNIK